MIRILRSSLVVSMLAGTQLLFAQTSKSSDDGGISYWDTLATISKTWWCCTLAGTIILGLLLGFFVYRTFVSNGRAGAATSSGCLVAVGTFLITQTVCLTILVFTVYANAHGPALKKSGDTAAHSSTGSATAGTPSGTTTPTKPTATGSTSGDDF